MELLRNIWNNTLSINCQSNVSYMQFGSKSAISIQKCNFDPKVQIRSEAAILIQKSDFDQKEQIRSKIAISI